MFIGSLRWAVVLVGFLSGVSAFAALDARLTIQSALDPVVGDGPDGTLVVTSFDDGVSRNCTVLHEGGGGGHVVCSSPTAVQFVITKDTDRATPALIRLERQGLVVSGFILRLYRPSTDGQVVNYFSIMLTRPVLASYVQSAGDYADRAAGKTRVFL